MILCGAGSIEETCTVGTICTFNGQVRMILCGAKIVYSSRFLTPGPPKTPSGSDANSPNDAGNGMQMTDRHNMVETVDPGTNFPKNLYIDETWERDIFGYRLKENQETGAVAERKVDIYTNSMFSKESDVAKLAVSLDDHCLPGRSGGRHLKQFLTM